MDLSFVATSLLAQTGVIWFALVLYSTALERVKDESGPLIWLSCGLLFGVTAAILIHMPGKVVDSFQVDLRLVPVAIAGLVAGPAGGAAAAFLASMARLEIGGLGLSPGLLGIWLGFAVGCVGWYTLPQGRDTIRHRVLISGLTAAAFVLVLLVLPEAVRLKVMENNLPTLLVLLYFSTTFLAVSYVKFDQRRKHAAKMGILHTQVVAALPDALHVKDFDGRFILANDHAAGLFGMQGAADLIGRLEMHFHRKEDARRLFAQDQALRLKPEPTIVEQTLMRDGREIRLSTVKAPYFDEAGELKGVVSYSTDVTVQRALEAELTATQSLLQTAINEMADGLALFDQTGHLQLWNRRYIELFPYVEDVLPGAPALADILRAGIIRGKILPPNEAAVVSWVEEEVARSSCAETSELLLEGGCWVAKKTSVLPNGGWVTLYADITEKKAALKQLEQMATSDGLTGLANRRYFDESLRLCLREAKEACRPLSLLLLDVDHFKLFNDAYGHPAGDQILKKIAATIKASSRGGSDIVARYGGEEFAVIMPDTNSAAAEQAAIRIRNSVRSLNILHHASPLARLTVSIGVATMDGRTDASESELLAACDAALYAAKSHGRDKVYVQSRSDLTMYCVQN